MASAEYQREWRKRHPEKLKDILGCCPEDPYNTGWQRVIERAKELSTLLSSELSEKQKKDILEVLSLNTRIFVETMLSSINTKCQPDIHPHQDHLDLSMLNMENPEA
jgi:uncharacterized protein with NRDE domain